MLVYFYGTGLFLFYVIEHFHFWIYCSIFDWQLKFYFTLQNNILKANDILVKLNYNIDQMQHYSTYYKCFGLFLLSPFTITTFALHIFQYPLLLILLYKNNHFTFTVLQNLINTETFAEKKYYMHWFCFQVVVFICYQVFLVKLHKEWILCVIISSCCGEIWINKMLVCFK